MQLFVLRHRSYNTQIEKDIEIFRSETNTIFEKVKMFSTINHYFFSELSIKLNFNDFFSDFSFFLTKKKTLIFYWEIFQQLFLEILDEHKMKV